jgi:hypothetical protein
VIENKAGADGAGLTLAIRLRLLCRHRRNVDHAAARLSEDLDRRKLVVARCAYDESGSRSRQNSDSDARGYRTHVADPLP